MKVNKIVSTALLFLVTL